jgi:hypothetical protein
MIIKLCALEGSELFLLGWGISEVAERIEGSFLDSHRW